MLAHVDLDAFYASVEELDNPSLAGKPVIVGGLGGRGVVSACSYAARKFGVRSAMPMFRAQSLCPQAVFLPVRMARYKQMSHEVMDILRSFSPDLEQISVDEAFLDLRGVVNLWGGSYAGLGALLKTALKEKTGLNCSVGIAPLRFTAKIASERCKPGGLLVVEDLEEFLATIELKEVSGVGEKSLARLKELGLRRLLDLRGLEADFVEARLGKHGLKLWQLAWGHDPRGVELSHETKSISNEHTFRYDQSEREVILSHLMRLCQKVGGRLRQAGLNAHTVTLKIKFPDFKQKTFSRTLAQPTNLTLDIFNNLEGFITQGVKIRLLGVGVANFREDAQESLFTEQRFQKLHAVEDYLHKRFGNKGLTRASALLTRKES